MKKRNKDIILISGTQNSGKTNTISLLYQRLSKQIPQHTFNGNPVNSNQINYPTNDDFVAIFKLKNRITVGMISAGDYLSVFKECFDTIKLSIDVLICTSRTKNTDSSVYNFIVEQIQSEGFELKLNFSTFPTENKTQMQDNIVNIILKYLNH